LAKKKRTRAPDDRAPFQPQGAPARVAPRPESAQAAAVVQPATQAESRLCSIKEYILLNVIFDAFCLLQLLLVRLFLGESRGLYFFFALLMIGFLFVSIFDYLYDRVTARPDLAAAE
jgi:hypothetical protein